MKRLLILYSLFSFLTIVLFVRQFHYNNVVIIGHTFFAALMHLFFITVSSVFLGKFLSRRIYFAIYFSLYFTVWALFYLLIFVSNSEWGDTIYFSMAVRYVKNLPEVFSYFQYSSLFYFISIIIYALAVVALHYFLFSSSKFSFKKIKALRNNFKAERISTIVILLVLLITGIGLSGMGLIKAKRYFHLQGEPILKFCNGYMWSDERDEYYSLAQLDKNKIEDAARKQFADSAKNGNHRNVVLLVIDALRADNLNSYGYPQITTPYIDSLLKEGKAFAVENAYSTTNSTLGGIGSLFLSKSYKNSAPMDFGLPEALSFLKYKINVLVSGDHSIWYSLAQTYKKYATFSYSGNSSKKYKMDDDAIILEGLNTLPAGQNKSDNFFYLHLYSAHGVGVFHNDFRKNVPDEYNPLTDGINSKITAITNKYNNRILQADAMNRSALEILKSKGYLNNTTVIITSDHGQSLGEGGRFGHVSYLHRESIRIPLIIIDDNPSLYLNKELARQIDIAPTIMQRIGLPIPATWEGKSLLNELQPTISFHENGAGTLNYHGFIQNDTSGIYRYLFSNDYREEELFKVTGNMETDIKATDSAKLNFFRTYSRNKFDSVFSKFDIH